MRYTTLDSCPSIGILAKYKERCTDVDDKKKAVVKMFATAF